MVAKSENPIDPDEGPERRDRNAERGLERERRQQIAREAEERQEPTFVRGTIEPDLKT